MERESNPLSQDSVKLLCEVSSRLIIPHRWGLPIRRGLSRRHTMKRNRLTLHYKPLRVAVDSNL